MSWFKKNKNKDDNEKLTSNTIRIRVNRLINNSAVETVVVEAQLIMDENNNTIIFDENNKIKELLPGQIDTLISDILYKLESHGLSKEAQLKKVQDSINFQEELIRGENKGFVTNKKGEKVQINLETEKSKLRLLKCVKYTLDYKKGEGFFESIEVDGTRSLTYAVIDGELVPYYHKMPTDNGEPIVLLPDMAQRKKHYKDAMTEAIEDYKDSNDSFFNGVLGVITKGLYVVLALGLIIWTIYLARWSGDMNDEALQPKIDALKLQIEVEKQECVRQLSNQITNNGDLIDYAKFKLEEEQRESKLIENQDISDIQI